MGRDSLSGLRGAVQLLFYRAALYLPGGCGLLSLHLWRYAVLCAGDQHPGRTAEAAGRDCGAGFPVHAGAAEREPQPEEGQERGGGAGNLREAGEKPAWPEYRGLRHSGRQALRPQNLCAGGPGGIRGPDLFRQRRGSGGGLGLQKPAQGGAHHGHPARSQSPVHPGLQGKIHLRGDRRGA